MIVVVVQSPGRVQLFVTPWTGARQTPLSMGFCRQEYWSGLPFPPPGNLSDPGIEPMFPTLQADSLPLSHRGKSNWFLPVTEGSSALDHPGHVQQAGVLRGQAAVPG